jgi:hypothetical protein
MPSKNPCITVRLFPAEMEALRRIASAKGVGHVSLARAWVRARIKREIMAPGPPTPITNTRGMHGVVKGS